MSTHTPGPWVIRDNCIDGAPETHPIAPGRGFVATVGFHADGKRRLLSDRQKANLRLIASAPDLLASLCAVLSFKFPGWETGKWDDVLTVKQARAAVARAKEGSK